MEKIQEDIAGVWLQNSVYIAALHEYVHCCTMVIGANPPMCLREGIALYLTNGKDTRYL